MAAQYLQLNKGGTPARLNILRMRAAGFNEQRPPSTQRTWRDMRYGTLRDAGDVGQGFNGDGAARVAVWYSHDGAERWREVDAHRVEGVRIDHTGWYTDDIDSCGLDLAKGIFCYLAHGRMLAGYRLTVNDERVYFPGVFDCDKDAARMADEHARVTAEHESEYHAQWHQQQKSRDVYDESLQRLRECIALRHVACMRYVRAEISALCVTLRQLRDELRGTDFAI